MRTAEASPKEGRFPRAFWFFFHDGLETTDGSLRKIVIANCGEMNPVTGGDCFQINISFRNTGCCCAVCNATHIQNFEVG
jgi:hypothetical protein